MALIKSDFTAVANAANAQITSLLQKWYPDGVIQKNEYCIGSVYGEAGQSMRVHIGSQKTGYWSDFAGDDSGTDLISLWGAQRSISLGKACRELAEQLGVRLSDANAQPEYRGGLKSDSKPAPAQAGRVEEATPEPKKSPTWLPILPVPTDAPPPPAAHYHRGRPDQFWTYKNILGEVLGYIYKFTKSDGKKEILPLTFCQHATKPNVREWQWISFPDPRPLYLPGGLTKGRIKLVVEGEKCADTGHTHLSDLYDSVSWPGGCKAPQKADFAALAGEHVILWPDADAKIYAERHHLAGQMMPLEAQPGYVAMRKIATILVALGCRVQIVDIPAPGAVPDTYDISDIMTEAGGRDKALQWLDRLIDISPPLPIVEDVVEPVAVSGDVPPASALPTPDGSTPQPAGASDDMPPSNFNLVRYQLLPSKNGGPKQCRENVYIAMCGDDALRGLVGMNNFSGRQEKLKTPPWTSTGTGKDWTEQDDFYLSLYLARQLDLTVPVPDIERGVAQAARDYAFNPVQDYLNSCQTKWDQKPRIVDAFAKYWGTADDEYNALVSVMFFVGLVARAYHPGIKHDYAPVFEGKQGKGKSTALSILGGEWFSDTPFTVGDKDAYLAIQGVWLYEIAELDAMNRSTITAIKAFMSSPKDRFRPPYARRMIDVYRTCAFGATTNQHTYFRDATGNRRYFPVEVGQLDLEALRADRDQLFGEAVWMFRANVPWHPSLEQENRLLKPFQESREIPDEWAGQIYDYLEGIEDNGQKNEFKVKSKVTARELLKDALLMDIAKISQAKTETMRIRDIMDKFGWDKMRYTSGAREWYYLRPKKEAANV